MNKKRLFFFLKLFVSFGLIIYVIDKTGLNTREGLSKLGDTLSGVDPLYFWASITIGVLLNVTSSWRWKILLKAKGIAVSLWRLLGFYYIGRFFNMFLPTSMGGDIARVWDLGKHTGQAYEALASVFMERFIGMSVLAAVSAIVLIFHDTHLPVITNSLLFVIGMVATLLWLVLDKRVFNFFQRLFSGIHPFVAKIFDKLEEAHQTIADYRKHPRTLAWVIFISIFFYLLAVLNVWVSARAFAPNIGLYEMLLAVPAIMLIMNLPVSIGGLGIMEAAYITTFELFGYAPELALSTALLMRFKTIINAIIGGIIHIGRIK